MSKKNWKKPLIWLLCMVYVFSTPLSVYAENDVVREVEMATEYLEPYEDAVEALEELTDSNDIYALVYLVESYAMKEDADINSETVALLASGQEVQIIGVSQDSGKNIWYQVSYAYDEGTLEGYIKRDNLASSNEYLLEWEAEYVQKKTSMRSRARNIVSYADVEQFPASYQDALYELKSQHPEWTFVKMNTNIDWNYAISVQCEGSRSLIYAKTAKESWKNGMYDSTWAYCTPGIVKYYFDPRNFLLEESVFQFEHLGYNPSCNTEETTQKAVDGTFMEGKIPGTSRTYANVLTEIGSTINISPILLASRIRQEQGNAGTSPLISGTYAGFEGLYNYYNIGAYGQTTEAVITTGLTKAREEGWTDRITALSGGATFLLKNYIAQGQDTLYLQKFDVDNRHNGVLWHQYMQNIQAPTTEAKSTYNTYKKTGLLNDMPFVFRIPVYQNMPEYACIQPGSEDTIALSTTSVENLPVDATAVLTTYINGAQNTSVEMKFTSSDEDVAIVDENGVITGISPGTAKITCQKKENPASANTVTCTVKVVKADIEIEDIELPKLDELVYSPNTTLKNISLPDGFTWVDESLVPTVNNVGYSVIYNPDSSKYNSLVLTLPLAVKKAELDQTQINIPKEVFTAVAGTELKSIALPVGYTWDAPDTVLPKKVGTYTYTASYCMDVENYEILKDISLNIEIVCKTHEFGEWTGEHADCENDGKLVRSCTICGEKEVVKETATGHSYVSEITKEPTTKEVGIRTFTCSICQDSYEEEIPKLEEAHKHSYVEKITKEPTCLEKGEKTFTCSCKDSYVETLEALGHDIVDGGCSRCDYVEPSLPSHTHSYTTSTVTATCEKAGAVIYTCGCGDTYQEEIKALGHEMKNGTCTRCEYSTNPPKEDSDEEEPSTSVEPSKEETKPSSSVEPSKEETKPSASVEPSKEETKPSASVEESKEETKPSSSVEPSKEETKPSSSVESSKEETKPSTSVEESKEETKPSSSVESSKEETKSTTTKEEESSESLLQSLFPKVETGVASSENTIKPQLVDDEEDTVVSAEEKLQTVQMNMRESTVLDATAFARIRESDKKLQINMANDVIWNIDLASIENREDIHVDLKVSLGEADIPKAVITSIVTEEHYELMTLQHEGDFGFNAELSVPVKAQYTGMIANLFYYNPDTKALEFIDSSKVSAEGYASFNMTHASEYVIAYANESMENVLEENVVEETESMVSQTVEASETIDASTTTDTFNVSAVAIAIIVIVLLAAGIISTILIWKKKKEDYYFDEEDDLEDDRIK